MLEAPIPDPYKDGMSSIEFRPRIYGSSFTHMDADEAVTIGAGPGSGLRGARRSVTCSLLRCLSCAFRTRSRTMFVSQELSLLNITELNPHSFDARNAGGESQIRNPFTFPMTSVDCDLITK